MDPPPAIVTNIGFFEIFSERKISKEFTKLSFMKNIQDFFSNKKKEKV